MPVRRGILILTALAVILGGCDIDDLASLGNSHAYEKNFHQTYPLSAGGRLSLDSFNGPVEISGWDQDRIEIDGVQYASSLQLRDAIEIDIVATLDSIQIRTIRPVSRRGNSGVKYIIKAPRRVNLDRISTSNGSVKVSDVEGVMRVRTSNGQVQAARVRGDLDVQTSNGSVEVRAVDGPANIRTSNGQIHADGIRGAFEASTSNGGIHARMDNLEAHRSVRLSTTNGGIELSMYSLKDNEIRATTSNGGITLKLPAQAGARLRARTSQNSIHTDFDVKREDRDGKNHLDGVIGSGGPTLDLTTSNGAIHVLKL